MQKPVYYGISDAVRDKMYILLAALVKIDHDPRYLGQYYGDIDYMIYVTLREGRKVYLTEAARDMVESHLNWKMDACLEQLSEFAPLEGQESLYVRYGRMFEDKTLGRAFNLREFQKLFRLMHFELAA